MSNFTIKRVLVVGGTHGNELTGVYLVKKFEEYPNIIHRSNFEALTLLANPKAIEAGRRYVDTDLNRCFNPQDLENKNLFEYEQLRAKQIAQDIREKQIDFIIDLHSTTANMGLTVILTNDHPFLLQLVTYLSAINSSVKILQYSSTTNTTQRSPYLRSLCQLNLAIEVGPIAQGILNSQLFQETETLIIKILDYVELYNQGQTPSISQTHPVYLYKQLEAVDYPRDNRGIKAMTAPELNDYEALNPGSSMFVEFSGNVLPYQGNQPVYPVFIGESSYVEKGVAMMLTERIAIEV